MIKKIFNKLNIPNLISDVENDASTVSFQEVGKCPKCGESIVQRKEFWTCEGVLSQSCNFSIPCRTDNGKEITIDMINFYYMLYQNSEMENFIKSAFNKGIYMANNTDEQSSEANNISSDAVQTTQPAQQTVNTQVAEPVQQMQPAQQMQNTAYANNVQYANTVTQTQPVANTNQQGANNNSFEAKVNNCFNLGRELANKCSCGGTVFRYGDLAACNKCNFRIATKYAEKVFSDEEMSNLIGKRISEYGIFKAVCSHGKPLKGRVYIDFNQQGNLLPKYQFVNNTSNIQGYHREQLFIKDKKSNTYIPLSSIVVTNKTSNNNTNNTNNTNNKQTPVNSNNVSGDGTHVKFNPFKNCGSTNSNSNNVGKDSNVIDDSEPF